jgi:hypothetical protein
MTQMDVLEQPKLRSANWEAEKVAEQAVAANGSR